MKKSNIFNKSILAISICICFPVLSANHDTKYIASADEDGQAAQASINKDLSVGPEYKGIALGSSSNAGNGGVAVGDSSLTGGGIDKGSLGIALGQNAQANSNSSISVGRNSIVDNGSKNSIGIGINSNINSSENGISLGTDSSVQNSSDSIAIGRSSTIKDSVGAVAIGANSVATAENSIALGRNSTADQKNTVSIGSIANSRKLVNLAAGSASTDATNVFQLNSVLSALGGGALLDEDGVFKGPSYLIQNKTLGTVGDALTALNTGVDNNKSAIDKNTNDIANNANSITSITSELNSGTVGLVRQDAITHALTVAAETGGTTMSISGTDGSRTLNGVKAGTLDKDSNDAVNGSQLYATNLAVDSNSSKIDANTAGIADNKVNIIANTADIAASKADISKNMENTGKIASSLGGGATLDMNGNFISPSYSIQGMERITVGDALTALNTGVDNNKSAIDKNTNDIANNANSITSITSELNSGTVGLVRQDAITHALTVAAETGGTTMSISGTDGSRTLNGVKAGTLDKDSNDAVNGSQLYATNLAVDSNTASILNVIQDITLGNMGLVKQDSNSLNLSVASNSGGMSVSFAGTEGSRLLSGVKPGRTNDDAVNISQLKDLFHELGSSDALIDETNGKIKGPRYNIQGTSYNLGDSIAALDAKIGFIDSNTSNVVHYDNSDMNRVSLGDSKKGKQVTITNLASGKVAAGSSEAVNGGQLYEIKTQLDQNTKDINNININNQASNANNLVQQDAQSQQITVGKEKSGKSVSLTGTEGDRVLTGIANGIADNDAATLSQVKDIAKVSSNVSTNNSSNRDKALASGKNSAALGGGAKASADESLAFGSNAKVTGKNSIAIGNDSVADRSNSLSVGSVGAERQITNVARGTTGSDAVNVNQLNEGLSSLSNSTNQNFRELGKRMKDMKDKLSGGVASAMAMGALPQPYSAGSGMMSIGGSTYNDQSAVAIGASKVSENGKWVTKVQGSSNTQGDFSMSAGIGYQW